MALLGISGTSTASRCQDLGVRHPDGHALRKPSPWALAGRRMVFRFLHYVTVGCTGAPIRDQCLSVIRGRLETRTIWGMGNTRAT
jgi:hypothetical protein